MSDIPETEKQIKAKITSYKTAFNKEKKMHGCISDGYGKRYLMFPLHLVLGDGKKAKEYIEWYDNEFPDDIGEPIQQICRTLIHYRLGESEQATIALAKTMLMNIYFIPQLLGEKVRELDIRHFPILNIMIILNMSLNAFMTTSKTKNSNGCTTHLPLLNFKIFFESSFG